MHDDIEKVAEAGVKPETPADVLPSEASLRPAQSSVAGVPGTGCGVMAGGARAGTALESMPGISPPPAAPSYVYVVGKVDVRFPSLDVEKEFAQAAGRMVSTGLTDREVLCKVLQENPYLARQCCYLLMVQELPTYILRPTCYGDFRQLVEAVCQDIRPTAVNVVIGTRGPIAPPEACNGVMVPIVIFNQIYSFDVDSLIGAIPRPEKGVEEERFEAAAEELFWRIMQLADNAGATDEHRALNYLVVRDPAIYAKAAEEFGKDFSLSAVETRLSPLSGTRKVVEVCLVFTNRNTSFTEKFCVWVDATGEWPFLVRKLTPSYDH